MVIDSVSVLSTITKERKNWLFESPKYMSTTGLSYNTCYFGKAVGSPKIAKIL